MQTNRRELITRKKTTLETRHKEAMLHEVTKVCIAPGSRVASHKEVNKVWIARDSSVASHEVV